MNFLDPNAPTSQAEDKRTTPAVAVTMQNFKAEVLEASRGQLVIVDFWAPWCEPCKQLTPILERTVTATKGIAKLCAVDIEQNPQIAQQMRIQSIPAVFAFWNGQPVDGFMGVIPEPQIKSWIDQLIKATGATCPANIGLDTALGQAETFLQEGDRATALSIFADLHSEFPDNAPAFSGLLRCLIADGQVEQAQSLLAGAPEALAKHKALHPVHAALELALQEQTKTGTVGELENRLVEQPNDHQTRFDLAMALYAQKDIARAIDELLVIVRADRKWDDDGARKQLVKFFEALGPDHPQVVEGRKKLSSVLFS